MVPLALLLALQAVLPLVLLLVLSWTLRWYYPALLPGEWSARGWASLLSPESRLPEALGNSLWVAAASAALGTALACPAARALARRPDSPLRVPLLAPLLLPAFAAVMGVTVVFVRLGLTDTGAGVLLAHLIPVTPYAVALLTATFERHDGRLEEQARSLGARRAQVWCRVTLPAVWPGLGACLAVCFLVSWNEYLLTLMVGGGAVLTLPVLLVATTQGGDTALTAATALVTLLPPLLAYAALGTRFRVAGA
ncbi:ABC transporter permease subunit [Deinococcus sp. YIM 134068]|uniref:ABC transporter permease n=1 Tax=Deinococcus lichenicola TaxID=3118910 RepID=UPI002F920A51